MEAARKIAFFEKNSWYHRTKQLDENGKIKYSKRGGFSSEEEAEESFYICQKQFEREYHEYMLAHEVNREIMFADYLRYWYQETFYKRVQSTTKICTSYILNSLLNPYIKEDIKLKYVTAEYLDALLEVVAKTTASAGNAARGFLYLAFKDAISNGYLKENPVEETKVYKRKKPNITILNRKQTKVLLKEASKGNWYLEILLALFCGLRKGELLGLKFSDFNIEERTVTISRQLGVEFNFDHDGNTEGTSMVEREPKTENSYRIIRVPDIVIEELKKRKMLIDYHKAVLGGRYENHDYISCQENGKPHSVGALNLSLTKICKRTGLPHVSVHALRHMYATILLEQSVPLAKISALLGHSSIHTTFEYYCDVMDGKDKIMSYMNDTFIHDERKAG